VSSRTKTFIFAIVFTKGCCQRLHCLLNLAHIFIKINILIHSRLLLRLIFVVPSHEISKPKFCSDFLLSLLCTRLNHFNVPVQILFNLVIFLSSRHVKYPTKLTKITNAMLCANRNFMKIEIAYAQDFALHENRYVRVSLESWHNLEVWSKPDIQQVEKYYCWHSINWNFNCTNNWIA
jgi:hypothetical protein